MNPSDAHSYDEEHERTKGLIRAIFSGLRALRVVRDVNLSSAHYQRASNYRPLNPKIFPYSRDKRSTISA